MTATHHEHTQNQEWILKYVLHTLLDQDPDTKLEQALIQSKCVGMPTVLSMFEDDIQALKYKDEDDGGTLKDVPRHQCNLIHVLQQFSQYCIAKQDPITDWEQVTVTQANAYHCSPHFNAFTVVPSANQRPSPTVSTTSTPTNIETFKRGIKQDLTVFKMFKDDQYWDNY